jgi:hypothetical protein
VTWRARGPIQSPIYRSSTRPRSGTVADCGILFEVLRGNKNLGLKSLSLQQTLCAPQNAGVVIDDEYQLLRIQVAMPLGSPERGRGIAT